MPASMLCGFQKTLEDWCGALRANISKIMKNPQPLNAFSLPSRPY